MAPTTVDLLLEEGTSRVFVRALQWPGWCRTAKTPDLAIDGLLEHAPRYALVAAKAGLTFPKAPRLEIVERVPGDSTTDFGAPSAHASADGESLQGKELYRWIALLEASWTLLDETAASSAEELQKGPRGGGRNRTKMLQHVLDAERAYAPKIGARTKPADGSDTSAVAANRTAIVSALKNSRGDAKWPLRYWFHRAIWHVLDHAWEMQDKQPPE